MIKYLLKNKTLFLIIILAFWLVPISISVPEQSKAESIVIAVGIDKQVNDDNYEVSLQYIVPSNYTTSEKLDLASAKDRTIDGAIQKLNSQLGKYSGFAHCRVILFNEEAGKSGITKMLDCFLRLKTNTNNIVLLSTKNNAKKVLTSANKLDSSFYSFLGNAVYSNELKNSEDFKNIGDYYNSYFGFSKCCCLNVVDVKEKQNSQSNNSNSQQNGEGGGESSEGQTQNKGEFVNEEKVVIIKNDNELYYLDKEQSDCINWFNGKVKRITFEITNFNDENLKNANLRFIVFNKENSFKAYFKDGQPTIDLNVRIYVRTSEVLSDNIDQEDYEVQQQVYSSKLYKRIKEEIISKLTSAEEYFKQNKLDCFNLNELFYKFQKKEYNDKLKTQTKDEFLQSIKFNYSVEIDKGA